MGGVVSESPICPTAPTVLNIGQFLDEDSTGHGWSQQEWLLAYAHTLQCVGEAVDGELGDLTENIFMPQISMLVDAFLEATGAKVVEVDVVSCWSELRQIVLQQRDKGAFADVLSHLDNLAQCLPPSAAPHALCWSGHLGYIQGWVVELG